jgi:hypothetical protein
LSDLIDTPGATSPPLKLLTGKTEAFKFRFLKDFASSFSDIAETGDTPCGPMATNKSNKVAITAVVRSRFRKLNEIRGIWKIRKYTYVKSLIQKNDCRQNFN